MHLVQELNDGTVVANVSLRTNPFISVPFLFCWLLPIFLLCSVHT